MTEKAKVANIDATGIPMPTPSQIREHAGDVGVVYIRIERRGKFQEMSIFNPELLIEKPPVMATLLEQIEAKLRGVIEAGRKP